MIRIIELNQRTSIAVMSGWCQKDAVAMGKSFHRVSLKSSAAYSPVLRQDAGLLVEHDSTIIIRLCSLVRLLPD